MWGILLCFDNGKGKDMTEANANSRLPQVLCLATTIAHSSSGMSFKMEGISSTSDFVDRSPYPSQQWSIKIYYNQKCFFPSRLLQAGMIYTTNRIVPNFCRQRKGENGKAQRPAGRRYEACHGMNWICLVVRHLDRMRQVKKAVRELFKGTDVSIAKHVQQKGGGQWTPHSKGTQ